jgi:hypothetical protein
MRRARWLAAMVALVLAVPALATAAPLKPVYGDQYSHSPGQQISMIAVIANPRAYDGRLVRLTGHLSTNHEDVGLYLSKADYDAAFWTNAIWVHPPPDLPDAVRAAINNRAMIVEGVFDADDFGYGPYSGALTKVRFLAPATSREGFREYPHDEWSSWADSVTAWRYAIALLFSVSVAFFAGRIAARRS